MRGQLACLVVVIATASAALAQQNTAPGLVETNVMLCDSPEHALAYAEIVDGGAAEDEAKDRVGKAAGREVCDKFIGIATTSEQRTMQRNGISYEVIAYKFPGVGRMKWAATPAR